MWAFLHVINKRRLAVSYAYNFITFSDQNIFDHSFITKSQIYTHVSLRKQKGIIIKNNPKNTLSI